MITDESDRRKARSSKENDNRTAFATDGLGRLIAMAEMGKVGAGEGDDLSSLPDSATATFSYDPFRWENDQSPAVSIARARETHGDAQTRWLEQRRYTDGLGREMMTKVQAEAGDAPKRDANGDLVYDAQTGELVYEHTDTRWVGTGRTVFDNKGEPVKQYEPFFSATADYESEDDVAASGVTAVIHRDPLGRVVRVEQPDGTENRVEFEAWQQTSYDAGDLVLGSDWHTAALAGSSEQVRAAQLSEDYAATPSVVHLDTLGREVLAQENGGAGIGTLTTTMTYDLEGQLLSVVDPRGLTAQQNTYDVAGRLIEQASNDAGTEKAFFDVMSQPVLSWTARGLRVRQTRDALQREVATYVDDGNSEIVTERMVYGEVHSEATTLNLNGKPYMTFDGAGQVVVDSYDFKDQPVSTTRRFAEAYAPSRQELDWSAVDGLDDLDDIAAAVDGLLEETSYTTSMTVDALDRVITQTTPDGAVTTTTYDEGGLLESIVVEAADEQTHTVLADIDENARGQRVREVLGEEAVVRSYEYDPQTFRLTRLLSERQSDSAALQDLRYTYDVVGNIVEVQDEAEAELYLQTSVVSGDRQYVYDPLYRLTWASGREHPGQQPTANSSPMFGQVPHPNDPTALSRYTETYSYDENGNLTQMAHSGEVSWTRNYVIDTATNRLVSHNRPSAPDPYTYSYDAAGNMLGMAHVSSMSYTSGEQMAEADLGGGGTAYYGYAGGERARKVIDHDGWTERRLYLGGWERYVRDNGRFGVERETLHVYEGERRIALIETKVAEGGEAIDPGEWNSRVRVQLDDHLGSAGVEVELSGAVIGYEEYFAYGATSFRMSSSAAEVSARRYRYIGKERDEETGLSYHSARYYAAWLGRWTTSDPAGLVDGPGTYSYCRGDPASLRDTDGRESTDATKQKKWGLSGGLNLVQMAEKHDARQKLSLKAAPTGLRNAAVETLAEPFDMGLLTGLPAGPLLDSSLRRPLVKAIRTLRKPLSKDPLVRGAEMAQEDSFKILIAIASVPAGGVAKSAGSLALRKGKAVFSKGKDLAKKGLSTLTASRTRASTGLRKSAKPVQRRKNGDLAVISAQPENATAANHARALAEARGEQLFQLGDDISAVPRGETLSLVGHGNQSSFAGLSPEQLASRLRQSGFSGQSLEIIGCNVGRGSYHQRVANRLRTTVRAPVDRANIIEDIRGVPQVRANGAGSPLLPPGQGWSVATPQGWLRSLLTRLF